MPPMHTLSVALLVLTQTRQITPTAPASPAQAVEVKGGPATSQRTPQAADRATDGLTEREERECGGYRNDTDQAPDFMPCLEQVRRQEALKATLDGVDGFKGTRWGAPLQSVRKAFPKARRSNDGFWYVDGAVAGLRASTAFVFARDQLKAVAVGFEDQPGRLPSNTFEMLLKLLASKYGTPKLDGVGDLASATWAGAKTMIILKSNPIGPRHVLVSYSSVALEHVEDKITAEEAQDL
jgi:hypothetical protein